VSVGVVGVGSIRAGTIGGGQAIAGRGNRVGVVGGTGLVAGAIAAGVIVVAVGGRVLAPAGQPVQVVVVIVGRLRCAGAVHVGELRDPRGRVVHHRAHQAGLPDWLPLPSG
jgi:hypothetical protein